MSGVNNGGMNRRKFLATAGTTLMMPNIMRAAKANDTSDLRIAIVGTGAEGQVLIDAALKIPDIRFVAVCDIWENWNRKRAARILQKFGHNVNEYLDYRDMIANEKDLDGVLIATPDFWHHTQTIDFLEAGVHVYCEKEMSNSLVNARKMVETARRTNKLLQIGHQRRSNPRYRHTYHYIIQEAQLLGRLTTINAQWNRAVSADLSFPKKYPVPPEILRKYGYKNMHQFRNWRWYKGLGGGAIVDLGSHQIDIFAWFTGVNPASVWASGGTDYYDKETHEWYDTVQTLWEYPTSNGMVRAFYQTITTNSNQGYYEAFMGDQATLIISESASRGAVYRETANPETPLWDKWVAKGFIMPPSGTQQTKGTDVRETVPAEEYKINKTFDDPYHKPHLENFFNAIRGLEDLNCQGEIGYETAVAVLKVNDAVRTKTMHTFTPEEFYI
ncbi:gfo/Idh/MocA family oxidoreductase [candidate division KSB1 bacterium]|nr:Gfo/Idh/MocA family oxidoreductase [candidate division KSB1 bacterium]RQW00140.1 MAG: gfo/Idh/MocA family oxidoreductase [candidate division KSB1 bacterium]